MAKNSTFGLPSPELHVEWKPWARALIAKLGQKQENVPVALTPYPQTKLPPANADAMLIWSEGKPYVSLNGEWIAVVIGDIILTSPDSTQYKLVVADDGTLSTEAV